MPEILREAAKGRGCTVRLPGCSWIVEETVLAHENGAGVGIKHNDLRAALACHHCHWLYDHRDEENAQEVELAFYKGLTRTLQIWADEGYVQVVKPRHMHIPKTVPRPQQFYR